MRRCGWWQKQTPQFDSRPVDGAHRGDSTDGSQQEDCPNARRAVRALSRELGSRALLTLLPMAPGWTQWDFKPSQLNGSASRCGQYQQMSVSGSRTVFEGKYDPCAANRDGNIEVFLCDPLTGSLGQPTLRTACPAAWAACRARGAEW
jgi:hypothetical protein